MRVSREEALQWDTVDKATHAEHAPGLATKQTLVAGRAIEVYLLALVEQGPLSSRA